MPAVLWVALVAIPSAASGQDTAACRFICGAELKIEPTFTVEHLAKPHRVVTGDGSTEVATREHVFETVFALDMPTRLPRLGFTFEAIFSPFSDDNSVELEFETNLHVLKESRTRGWVTSHFDIVGKLSPAERPRDRRAYTWKLDFEYDTAFHVFKRLKEDRWLHGLELEVSLDYLATGLPKKGDVFADGTRFLDDASPWSVSFVIVIPVAPF